MGLNSLNYLGRVDAVAKIEIVSAGKVDLRQEVKMIYDKLEGGEEMPKVTFITVGGNTIVDRAIQSASDGETDNVTHIAMGLGGHTWEALGIKEEGDQYPGFWAHHPEKYVGNPDAKFIAIEVPDLTAILRKAEELKGTPYGLDDCVQGGVYEKTGLETPDTSLTMDCSEAGTRCLRTVVNVLPDIKWAGNVVPERFYRYLINDLGGEDITEWVCAGGEIPGMNFRLG